MGEYGTLARWLKEQFKRPDLDMSIYIYTRMFLNHPLMTAINGNIRKYIYMHHIKL
jgi:hypothetical protein